MAQYNTQKLMEWWQDFPLFSALNPTSSTCSYFINDILSKKFHSPQRDTITVLLLFLLFSRVFCLLVNDFIVVVLIVLVIASEFSADKVCPIVELVWGYLFFLCASLLLSYGENDRNGSPEDKDWGNICYYLCFNWQSNWGNKKLREYVHCYRDNRKSEFKFGFGRC